MEEDKNRAVYLALGGIYLVLYLVLYFLVAQRGAVEISITRMVEPFASEEYRIMAYTFAFLAVAELGVVKYFLERAMANPQERLIALVIPNLIAVYGFVLGFLTLNLSVALPFMVFGFLVYLYEDRTWGG